MKRVFSIIIILGLGSTVSAQDYYTGRDRIRNGVFFEFRFDTAAILINFRCIFPGIGYIGQR